MSRGRRAGVAGCRVRAAAPGPVRPVRTAPGPHPASSRAPPGPGRRALRRAPSPEETTLHGPDRHSLDRHGLDRLNSASPGAAEAALLACCGSRQWAHHLADHRPYPDLRTLLGAAERTTHALTPAALTEALADEAGPHLPAEGTGLHRPVHAVLRQAQAAYEHRFGHVFLACLDGTPPDETVTRLLAALRLRLTRAPHEEAATTVAELTRLALGRLARLASDTPCARSRDTPYDTWRATRQPHAT